MLDVALAEEAELDQELSAEGGGEIDGAGRRILVVDDHPQSRDMLCDLLDGFGFESVPAGSGEEALSALQKQAIDLVVTDQFMPGMDGWALLRALRSEYAAVPVLLYSSLPPRRAEDGLAFDDALLKPASGKQLLEHVDRLLSGVNSET